MWQALMKMFAMALILPTDPMKDLIIICLLELNVEAAEWSSKTTGLKECMSRLMAIHVLKSLD
jgi:hypothetical protein